MIIKIIKASHYKPYIYKLIIISIQSIFIWDLFRIKIKHILTKHGIHGMYETW